MGKTTKSWERKFGGRTEGFLTKEEEKFEKKHLKAYIKGYDRFISSYNVRVVAGIRIADPVYSKVKQTLTKIED